MNNLLRGLIAGYGAKKLGGGCFGTILVFVLIWVALGQCSCSTIATSKKHHVQNQSHHASIQVTTSPVERFERSPMVVLYE